MNTIVKVAAFRSETDHLYRIANVDYHACVGVREIEYWKETARRVLGNAEGLQCVRANADDRDQFAKAIAAVKSQLIAADARIIQLQSTSTLTPTQRAAAERMRSERPNVLPGTNVIADHGERLRWYNKVADAMHGCDVRRPQMVAEFCDIAGVAN